MLKKIVPVLSLFIGTLGLGFFVKQSDFYRIICLFAPAFAGYCLAATQPKDFSTKQIITIALLIRFFLIFAFPALSDDIYRFYWDGILSSHGYNPYAYLPTEALELKIPQLNHHLFNQLNSPSYYSVYPPVNQLVFFLGALFFPNSIFGASIFYGIILWISEMTVLYLLYLMLKHYNKDPKHLIWYAWNPLVIVETANLHFESLMLALWLISIYCLVVKNKNKLSVLSFALSVSAKLHTLLLAPIIFLVIKFKKAIHYFALLALMLSILFLPVFLATSAKGFLSGLDLYFRRFEFNASIYYLLRYLGFKWKAYNMIATIGPAMAVLALCSIIAGYSYHFLKMPKPKNILIFRAGMWAFCCYLFFSTTVHPWYLITPIALAVFTRFRFMYLWSFLATISYINYSFDSYYEPLLLVALNYAILALFILYELLKRPQTNALKS